MKIFEILSEAVIIPFTGKPTASRYQGPGEVRQFPYQSRQAQALIDRCKDVLNSISFTPKGLKLGFESLDVFKKELFNSGMPDNGIYNFRWMRWFENLKETNPKMVNRIKDNVKVDYLAEVYESLDKCKVSLQNFLKSVDQTSLPREDKQKIENEIWYLSWLQGTLSALKTTLINDAN